MNNLVYLVISRYLDDDTVEGVFSTNQLAQEFVSLYKENEPEYADHESPYYDVFIKTHRIDEEVLKSKHLIYRVEYDVESNKWSCEKINRWKDRSSLLEDVCSIEDENDNPEWCYVHICRDASEEDVFTLGKSLIGEYLKHIRSKE